MSNKSGYAERTKYHYPKGKSVIQQFSLPAENRQELLRILRERFEKNINRHKDVKWENIQAKLEGDPVKIWSLSEMERTGGEPDVVKYDIKKDEYFFMDCSVQSPSGRRSICYDHEALKTRKKHKPKDSAINMAAAMRIEILTEEQYRMLQTVGEFDTKTSSWIKTPDEIRKPGGALFCDRRYNHVFTYHNSAESYYAARGFRGLLIV